jgi:2-polyprenyl-3-methyl-5-hydroxy-6-metoxy-1,4-benzoquinol methylase
MLSYVENIQTILRAVKESGAKRILDVGGGFGKYALLIKEDNISSQAEGGNMSPDITLTIDCCEDTKYFVDQPHHDKLYDKHIHEDIFTTDVGEYDLILFIDTVEHWDKEKTKELMAKLKGKKLISTPKKTHMYHEHYYGDPRHHISQWEASDFQGKDYSTDQSHIYII